MNREIKFRAWSTGKNNLLKQARMIPFKEISKQWHLYQFLNPDSYGVILMQYTGLKDKNGVEIYEGDILEGHSDGNGVVTWSDYDGGYDYQFKDGEIVGISEVKRHCFVIGNIHQNPELL